MHCYSVKPALLREKLWAPPVPFHGFLLDALTRFERSQQDPRGVPLTPSQTPTTRPQQCYREGSKHQLPLSLGANERSSFCSWGEVSGG